MAYLIDTDIIIYSLKNNSCVQYNFKRTKNYYKSISVITYAELKYGANKSSNYEKNIASLNRISEIFPIIPISKSIADTFSEVKSILEKKGDVTDDMDLLIAATALTMNLILVTNNVKHFNKIKGLKIENWTE